jgi:hypothetical protein
MPTMKTPSVRPRFRRACCAAALPLLAAACTDRTLTLPAEAPAPQAVRVAECRVDVAAQTMVCTATRPAGTAARADKFLGNQDVYVRLSSSGTSYDSGTEILSSNVTLQNLVRKTIGTTDGSTVSPVRVFFSQIPVVTSGTGSVSVANPDGFDAFTASNQPYFSYAEILTPYRISSAHTWQFNVPSTVGSFVFGVFVSSPMVDYTGPMLDEVWTGAVDSAWATPGNWSTGVVPDSASTVSIPADSLLPSHRMPVLTAAAALTNLRVGFGSTLALNELTLTAWGNVDAVGTVSGGTLWLRGSGALLDGRVGALVVGGGTQLQGATAASRAVSVSGGSLSVSGRAFSIQIP